MEYLSENNRSIGRRMRHVRRAAQMTQEKLADTLGITVNYLGEVERGRKPLSRALADQFCQYFHVTYDYLYHGIRSSSRDGIRERSFYESIHNSLQEQLRDCSPEEMLMISQLVETYLDVSRNLTGKNPKKDHTYRQYYTGPEDGTPNLS